MTRSRLAGLFAPIVVIALTATCHAGTVAEPQAMLNFPGSSPALRITQTDPGPRAWALWDNLGDDLDRLPAITTTMLVRHEPSPVAPLPPAVFSGGSILLAGALLRLKRKIRLG